MSCSNRSQKPRSLETFANVKWRSNNILLRPSVTSGEMCFQRSLKIKILTCSGSSEGESLHKYLLLIVVHRGRGKERRGKLEYSEGCAASISESTKSSEAGKA